MSPIINGIKMGEHEIEENITRQVIAFKIETELFAMEFELNNATLGELRNQFGFEVSDPYLLDAYCIEQKHVKWIEKHSGVKLDFSKYKYSLESS